MNKPQVILDLPSFAGRLMMLEAFKVSEGGFIIKSHEGKKDAPPSPYYVNLRIPENKDGTLTYGEVFMVACFFHDYIKRASLQFDGIVGLPRAGEPFANRLQEVIYHSTGNRSVPLLVMEKEETNGGRRIGKVIRNRDLPYGSKVLVIDDLISSAESKKEAIEELEKAGYRVSDVLVFLDREQGGRDELLREKNVKLHSIVTIRELLKIYEKSGALASDDTKRILAYVDSFKQEAPLGRN